MGGCSSFMKNDNAKRRHLNKLCIIGGRNPHETDKNEWKDDIDLWPSIIHANLGIHLLVTPSSYSGEYLLKYKSLVCYRNFLSCWVRDVLVRCMTDDTHGGVEKRVVTAKVCNKNTLARHNINYIKGLK